MPNTYPFYIHQKDTKYMLLSYEQSTNTYRPINLENVQGISKLQIIKIFHVVRLDHESGMLYNNKNIFNSCGFITCSPALY